MAIHDKVYSMRDDFLVGIIYGVVLKARHPFRIVPNGSSDRLKFQLDFGIKQKELAELCHTFFQQGNVWTRDGRMHKGKPAPSSVSYIVTKREGFLKVIEFFDSCPSITSTHSNYEAWKRIALSIRPYNKG